MQKTTTHLRAQAQITLQWRIFFSKLMKDSGLGSKSSAQNHQSESESVPKGGKPKESRDDRLDRLEQMVRQMTENQGHYDYYYDEPDYDGAGYKGYYAPEGNTQKGYYASEGTTQNDAASGVDMAPEKVTEGTIKDTPKSAQNESVGFAAKYASEAQGKALDPEVANNVKFLVTTKLSEKSYGDMLEKYETPTKL